MADEKNKGTYTPSDAEKRLFHVKLERPAFNPRTGQKLSKAYIQKFSIAEWSQFKRHSEKLGYTAEVLWNPTNNK